MTRNALGEVTAYGILTGVGAVNDFGIQTAYGAGGNALSATFTTFTSADYTPTADGSTQTALTFTAKDASDAALEGVGVTASILSRVTVSASLSDVNAATTTPVDTATPVTIVIRDADGNGIAGIPAALVVVSASGANNTIVQPTGFTDATGAISGATYTATTSGSRTITVTVGGLALSDTPSVDVGGSGLALDADWGTATGTGSSAVTDGGLFDATSGDNSVVVLTVEDGTALGFDKTANVLAIGIDGTADYLVIKTDAVPASTTHWGQCYIMNDEPDPANNVDHALAMSPTGTIQAALIGRLPITGGTQWILDIANGGATYPNNRHSVTLSNGTWYRYAWEMRFLTATTYRIFPEIYSYDNAAPTDPGTLLFDSTDFIQNDGGPSDTLQAWYDLGNSFSLVATAEATRDIGVGQEGQAGAGTGTGALHIAQLRLSTLGPIGAGA